MPNFDLFDSVFNEFGTFSDIEKSIASIIYSITSNEIEKLNVHFQNKDSDIDFDERIEITKNNLQEIIELFKKASRAKDKFEKRFPEWSPLRNDNINRLREISDCINSDRRNCNIAKITSSITGVLGGAALISSMVFPPAGAVLAIGGGVTSALSGAAVFGTSVTEMTLLKKKVGEAKEIIFKDEEDFKLIAMWFKHSQDLINAFEKVIGFSLAAEIFDNFKNFGADLVNFKQFTKGPFYFKLRNLINKCVKNFLIEFATNVGIFTSFHEMLVLFPIIVTFIFVIVLLRKNNSIIFDCVVISHRIAFGLVKILDLSSEVGIAIFNAMVKTGATASAEAVSKVSARVIAHGVFASLGIALDMTNVIFASIDIHKGSINPFAMQLKEVANKLEQEHQLLNSVYEALFQSK